MRTLDNRRQRIRTGHANPAGRPSVEGACASRDKPNTPAAGAALVARARASMYPRSTLASAFTESSFTCYKLLSRIQESFLFVNHHAVIKTHEAARRSELAYCSRQCRQLIVAEP